MYYLKEKKTPFPYSYIFCMKIHFFIMIIIFKYKLIMLMKENLKQIMNGSFSFMNNKSGKIV